MFGVTFAFLHFAWTSGITPCLESHQRRLSFSHGMPSPGDAAATFLDLCVPKTSDSDVAAMRSAKDRI